MIRFATCERRRALEFLKKFYPSRVIEDTPESAGPVLDLVEQDLFRIPDPDFHGGTVFPGPKWDESRREECVSVMDRFHNATGGAI